MTDSLGRRYSALEIDGHVHTHFSGDAILPPEKVVILADRRKLDAIVFTDHNSFKSHDAELPRTKRGVLVIYGMEVGLAGVHIGAWNLSSKPRFQKRGPGALQTLIQAVREQPDALLILNHPGWRVGESYFRLETFVGPRERTLDAVEIWNGTFWQFVAGNIARWEEFMEAGIYVPAVANSDSHYFTLGSPRNVLWVTDRTTRGVLEAVRDGRGYMTDDARIVFLAEGALPGQLLRLERQGATIRVLISGHSQYGGELRLFHGKRVIFEKQLEKGAFRFTPNVLVGERDGWLRVEIRRQKEIRTRQRFTYTLLTNPVLYDVPPYDDHWDLERERRGRR
ncbi:MAG: PHP domain-containing protein [Myxococcales bacterium]|nr:PHP domain-containing protein [Myxococcales bacterium]